MQNTATQMGDIKGPKTLTCVPFSYPYGFVTSALTSLLWGKEAILAPDIGKSTIGSYYAKKPNIIFGSPALLELTLHNVPPEQDLSSVTHFISGGDFLTVQQAQRGTDFLKSMARRMSRSETAMEMRKLSVWEPIRSAYRSVRKQREKCWSAQVL